MSTISECNYYIILINDYNINYYIILINMVAVKHYDCS